MRTTEYYVHLSAPGVFMPETVDRKIDGPDEFDIPWDVYAWHTYEIIVDRDGDIELRSTPQRQGARHLLVEDGPYTANELPAVVDAEEHRTLISNARQYPLGVARTSMGNWQPVLDDDVVERPADIADRRCAALFYESANPAVDV